MGLVWVVLGWLDGWFCGWVEVAGCFLFVLLDSDLGVSFALCAGV